VVYRLRVLKKMSLVGSFLLAAAIALISLPERAQASGKAGSVFAGVTEDHCEKMEEIENAYAADYAKDRLALDALTEQIKPQMSPSGALTPAGQKIHQQQVALLTDMGVDAAKYRKFLKMCGL